MGTRYNVYCTPKKDPTHYGSEVDISDYVDSVNTGQITRSIDSTDYDIGIFTYADVQMNCANETGFLSDNKDSRSMFSFTRDQAKVRIEFNKDGTPLTRFTGIIADAASQTDVEQSEVNFRILGLDSVLKNSKIAVGTITNGMTVQNALSAILNTSDVTAVLNYSPSNINPANNINVDLGSKFDNVAKNTAIDQLLVASNSILIIDSSNNVIIQSRADNAGNVLYLYGKGNAQGKENIIGIKNYNTGLNRMFNSVFINSTIEVHDDTAINSFGFSQKTLNLDWLTDTTNTTNVANALLTTFKYPKIEMEVQVPTEVATGYNLLDRVCIDFPLYAHPTGPFFPVCGITVCGDANSPLPVVRGAVQIDPSLAFKIISISEDVDNFTTTLKVRQIGTGLSDGTF